MAHVLRYLRKSGRNELRTASDAVQDLDLPLNSVSEEDEELISSNSLIEGASYGTPEDVDTPAPSQRFGSPSQRLGFTDRYVDWSHSQDSIFKAKVAFVLYLFVAIVVYSFILEQWSIIDSVYFAVIVFTTVGTLQVVLLGDACIIHRLRFVVLIPPPQVTVICPPALMRPVFSPWCLHRVVLSFWVYFWESLGLDCLKFGKRKPVKNSNWLNKKSWNSSRPQISLPSSSRPKISLPSFHRSEPFWTTCGQLPRLKLRLFYV
jgi:hypothetical protein